MPVRLFVLVDLLLFAPAMVLLFSGAYSSNGPTFSGLSGISLATVAVIRWGIAGQAGKQKRPWSEYLSGLATLTALYALVEQVTYYGVDAYPVIYALITLVFAFHGRMAALGLLVTAIAFEWLLWAATAGQPDGRTLEVVLSHGVWIAVFASLHRGFGALARWRLAPSDGRTPAGKATRFFDPAHDGETQSEEHGAGSLIESAQDLVKVACNADTVSFLDLLPGGEELLVSAATEPSHLAIRLDAKAGIAASALRANQAVTANGLRRDFPSALPTTTGGRPAHVMAIPLVQSHKAVGVLLAQRNEGPPFQPEDLDALKTGAKLVAAALGAERAVERVSEAHYELERFFDASRLLNSALSPDQVYGSATQALKMITDFDLLAITWVDEGNGPHRIVHASGPLADGLEGLNVEPELSLAAMVMKNGHYLPLGCEVRSQTGCVMNGGEHLESLRSLVVLPLRLHDRVTGTLVIGSITPHAFNDARRGMAEVISNQVAVSLAKAKVYARVEEMATIDALTRLYNRRAFQQRLNEAQARAMRSKNPLSLVLLDIDHFKVVNDTHGHPVGDVVLTRLGETMARMFRRTDTAARHGGEEFALILEDTDCEGAMVMAERLRHAAAELPFKGARNLPFSVTLSLGVATFPVHTDEPEDLMTLADQALYEAKRSGRNQTRLARPSRHRRGKPEPRPVVDETGLSRSPDN